MAFKRSGVRLPLAPPNKNAGYSPAFLFGAKGRSNPCGSGALANLAEGTPQGFRLTPLSS